MTKKKRAKNPPFAAITNFPSPIKPPSLSNEDKIDFIASRFKEILEVLGLDLTDDSLGKAPLCIAKMYVQEVFKGLDYNQFPNISFLENKYNHPETSNMVLVKAQFTSFCEHHFVPMNGSAFVAYLPNKKLIGLSKIPEIVRFFAQRPQLQERLTAQIADSLAILLETENVAVTLNAQHHCVTARGVEDEHGRMSTHILRGQFNTNPNLRREFFEEIQKQG